MHPLNPAHPQYAELVEAGRAPANVHALWPVVERDPLACGYWFEDRRGVEQTCDEPAAFEVRRADGRGVAIRLCDRDLVNYSTDSTFVVARVSCSRCDVDAKRYELDHDGRCDECRP
jgi:hypothetical protein